MTDFQETNLNEEEKKAKIKELREIIKNAQETISSATQLLSILQGNHPENLEEPLLNKAENTVEEDGQIIYGYFDGQIMIGDDGKQYPVPANYASKSKLVEGDKLKLTITPDNHFIYKQIGPVQRNYLIGIIKKDNKGNFTVQTPQKEYRVLLAAATYFKIEPGDEVTLIVPQDRNSIWGAIENILQKYNQITSQQNIFQENAQQTTPAPETTPSNAATKNETSSTGNTKKTTKNIQSSVDKDVPDLSILEKMDDELKKEGKTTTNKQTEPPSNTEIIQSANNTAKDEWDTDIEQLKQEAGIAINTKQ